MALKEALVGHFLSFVGSQFVSISAFHLVRFFLYSTFRVTLIFDYVLFFLVDRPRSHVSTVLRCLCFSYIYLQHSFVFVFTFILYTRGSRRAYSS